MSAAPIDITNLRPGAIWKIDMYGVSGMYEVAEFDLREAVRKRINWIDVETESHELQASVSFKGAPGDAVPAVTVVDRIGSPFDVGGQAWGVHTMSVDYYDYPDSDGYVLALSLIAVGWAAELDRAPAAPGMDVTP